MAGTAVSDRSIVSVDQRRGHPPRYQLAIPPLAPGGEEYAVIASRLPQQRQTFSKTQHDDDDDDDVVKKGEVKARHLDQNLAAVISARRQPRARGPAHFGRKED